MGDVEEGVLIIVTIMFPTPSTGFAIICYCNYECISKYIYTVITLCPKTKDRPLEFGL